MAAAKGVTSIPTRVGVAAGALLLLLFLVPSLVPGSSDGSGSVPLATRVVVEDGDVPSAACVPSAALVSGERVGIARCDNGAPDTEAIPPYDVASARVTLFGHCATRGDSAVESAARETCPTVLRSVGLIKAMAPANGKGPVSHHEQLFQVTARGEMNDTVSEPPSEPEGRFAPWAGLVAESDDVRGALAAGASADLLKHDAELAQAEHVGSYAWQHGIIPARAPAGTRELTRRLLASRSLPVVKYDVAVMLPPLTTCMSNLYHGLFDNLLPVMQALMAVRRLHPGAQRIALLVRMIPLSNYGNRNSRCGLLNRAPYGFGEPAHTAFVLDALRRGFKRLDVIFYNERWRRSGRQDANATFFFATLYRGLPASCFTMGASVEQSMSHSMREYPLVKRSRRCSKVVDATRAAVLRSLGIAEVPPVSPAEAACPDIIVVSRQNRGNGRAFTDFTSVIEGVQEGLMNHTAADAEPGCGSVRTVHLEKMSISEQIRLMQNATVVVAARGAGQVMALFMREGAALVGLSPRRPRFPLVMEDATEPWAPWGFALEGRHTVLGTCPFAEPVAESPLRRTSCLVGSANFCMLRCSAAGVSTMVRAALGHVHAAALERGSVSDASTFKLQTSYVVPRVTRRRVTSRLRKSLLHMAKAAGGRAAASNALAEQAQFITSYHPSLLFFDEPSELESATVPDAIDAAANDAIVRYLPPDGGRGPLSINAFSHGRFDREQLSHGERLGNFVRLPNHGFSLSVLGAKAFAEGNRWISERANGNASSP